MNKEEIVKIAVAAVREYDAKQKKSRHDMRLRNTKLLLENYNLLMSHCKNAIYDKQHAVAGDDESAIDALDEFDKYDSDTYIEAIKSSVTRTAIILDHIDNMIGLYKVYCEKSTKQEDKRRFRVLQAVYLDELKMKDVCEAENIDRSTYFRDTKEIREKLSALIFGIDGLYICDKDETTVRLSSVL